MKILLKWKKWCEIWKKIWIVISTIFKAQA